jgi:putative transposase
VEPIESHMKEISARVCQEYQAEIEELEVMPDHMQRLVKLIKGRSSRLLRQEFAVLKRKFPSLWANSYVVSTSERHQVAH